MDITGYEWIDIPILWFTDGLIYRYYKVGIDQNTDNTNQGYIVVPILLIVINRYTNNMS